MTAVPAHIYQLQARGEISQETVADLEKFASVLNEKQASGFASFGAGLAHGIGATAATAVVGVGGAMAMGAAIDKLTFKRDLANVLKVNAHLKQEFPAQEIETAFRSIRSMNPEFAKDPLVAGHLLGQILRNRDPMNPKLPPRVDTQLAIALSNAGKYPSSRIDTLSKAFGGGYAAGSKNNR